MDRREHLTDAQVEQYGVRAATPEPEAVDRARQTEAHLADCPACRTRVLESQRTRLALLTDRPVNSSHHADRAGSSSSRNDRSGIGIATRDCPDEDTLRKLAATLCPPDQALKLTQHASQCNHCGLLLRMYTEDFSDDLSAEDQAVLGKLKSSSVGWQQKLAEEMLSGPGRSSAKPERKPFLVRRVLAPIALATCAALAFAIWYSQRETPEKVEKLLAQAYTENRQLEMRIPYAKHAEFHQLRSGDAESILNTPASLQEATQKITLHLKKRPDDPEWLILSARVNLLDWRYKPALATLETIEESKALPRAEIESSRALALYEKAEVEHDTAAYGQAVDLLGRVLQETPNDSVALFNQAVACEKLHMYECASHDYQQFLKVERDSSWSDEARDHLNRVQEKKNLESPRSSLFRIRRSHYSG